MVFFRWGLKTPFIKNSECKCKMIISTISHFWSSNNFLVICILIFHGTFFPFFPYFSISSGPFVLGDLISFLEKGGGGKTIFFHKSIIVQSWKLKKSWWQNYLLHMYMLTFHTFNWEFSLWEFSFWSSVHWIF